MQPNNRVEVSDKERYKKYYKTPKSETAFSLVWTPIKEYGIFIFPLLLAYLLLYFVIFEGGGKEDGNTAVYIIVGVSIIVVTACAKNFGLLMECVNLNGQNLLPIWSN